MIYLVKIKHSRRTHSPSFILPKTHEYRKHPMFRQRPIRLPEERFYGVPEVYPFRTRDVFETEFFPEWIRFETPEKEVQDFYHMQSWIVVSQRVKDKIEELEPNLHQFVPVKLLQKDGSEPWGQYYFFHIRQHFFSIDEAKSPYYKWHNRTPDTGFDKYLLKRNPDAVEGVKYSFDNIHFVYRSAIVKNSLIWREVLDRNTAPNTGTRWVIVNAEGERGGQEKDPENPTKAVYNIDEEFGFRLAGHFKDWMDEEKVKGLDCSNDRGVLDTDWNGVVK